MNRETALSNLARAVNDRGNYEAHLRGGPDGERLKLIIGDTDLSLFVSVYPESQSSPGAPRWRMTIGIPGRKARFMQRKDGGFDYPRGARCLEAYVGPVRRSNARKDVKHGDHQA